MPGGASAGSAAFDSGAQTGPPVPDVARTTPPDTMRRSADPAATGRNTSLVDRIPTTLFDRARSELTVRRSGLPMAPILGSQAHTAHIRREANRSGAVVHPVHPDSELGRQSSVADQLSNREWDDLVDIVVQRIEQRVVDELTRRGRRSTPGVF